MDKKSKLYPGPQKNPVKLNTEGDGEIKAVKGKVMDWLTATEFLLKQSRKRQEELKTTLVNGGAADYTQYQHLIGEIKGLNFIENEIIGLHKRMETADEE